MKIQITRTYWVDEAELWSGVMGSGWERYPWWTEVVYRDGDWEDPNSIISVSWNCEGYSGTGLLAIDDIAYACGELGLSESDLRDIDADLADQIIQQATIGKVVFG